MTKIRFDIPADKYRELPELVHRMFPQNCFEVGSLSTHTTKKAMAGEKYGWLTAGVFMAPNDSIGLYNVCGSETKWCKAACLAKGKRYGLRRGHRALIARNLYWGFYKEDFKKRLVKEISLLLRHAARYGMNMCFRINGTSDIPYESAKEGRFLQQLLCTFPDVVFFDYTKHYGRMLPDYQKVMDIKRYHLTYSHSGENWHYCERLLKSGANVAMVFPKTKLLPTEYRGRRVIDGDDSDLRFLDPDGVIVGLRQKKSYRTPGVAGWVDEKEVGPFVTRIAEAHI